MNIATLLPILRRNLVLLVALVILGLAGGVVVTRLQAPSYTATARVFISTQGDNSVTDLNAGTTYTQQVAKSYGDVATTQIVLAPVIAQLRLPYSVRTLAGAISVTVPPDEAILDIQVSDRSAARASAIANAVANQLNAAVNLLNPTSVVQQPTTKITQVQAGVPASAPSSPKLSLNVTLGLITGVILALVIIAVRESLDQRVRSPSELADLTDLPLLGEVTNQKGLEAPDFAGQRELEQYRSIRTAIRYLDHPDRLKVICITSAGESEGKSTSSAQLALTLAESGKTVLLVDGDLRRPSLGARFGIDEALGLSDVLVAQALPTQAIQPWGSKKLSILPAGTLPPNPSVLLESEAMRSFLEDSKKNFDFIVMDSPPALTVADATILTHLSDGAILVAAIGQNKRPELRSATNLLNARDVPLVGIIATKVHAKSGQNNYYGVTA